MSATGWEALGAAIAEVRAMIADAAPDQEAAAEGEGYAARALSVALAGTMLGRPLGENGLIRALPCWGGPNPDYVMLHALIDPARRYRLTGRLNGSERVAVGLYAGGTGAPGTAAYTAFNAADWPPDREFSLEIATSPESADGLAIPHGARVLLVRVLHRSSAERAWLSLEGGAPGAGLPDALASDAALHAAAARLRDNVREYLKWTAAALALANRLVDPPAQLARTVNSDADTRYFLGGFDLADGEWLEVTMPAGLDGYWSLHAHSIWYEQLQTPGVDDRNAVAEADGRVRIAVGPVLPADARNRIDTAGRRRGAFVCRMIGSNGDPATQLRTLP